MPTVTIASSPLAPHAAAVPIHYRDIGAGPPLLFLHGGWGYEIYPFDRQIDALASGHRILIPDRTGYGGSGRLETQEVDFHERAAIETLAVIDALGLERPVVWGHSDGAVIALRMGLAQPSRLAGLIVEAAHLYRNKPASREFFETMMKHPDALGDRVTAVLARDHGERWREVIRMNGAAWLRIAEARATEGDDLYGGRLPSLRVPTLILHGGRDPRTEPGELDALRAALPAARVSIIADGGHSPHSERLAADATTAAAEAFFAEITRGIGTLR